ncbi:acyl-CoA reductase [Arsenicibacter rosenii]|uniref:Acyl-CoA reductase n=1 Tax=Arsenicibacter rosenii TaxID=1750698 RepID=A0A1S2VGM1_9BACT|nr:acyl-CoA reductase [Arsenicibacter rosenii]OIN57346.1 acyl-CoA reductase [Arsenicibacter rosenii]
MTQNERIQTFIALGDFLRSEQGQAEIDEMAWRANTQNNWFTPANVKRAFRAISDHMLTANALTEWAAQYPPEPETPMTVGVVMAGNIPAVGFHDLLCVLVSGHRIMAKLSSQDIVLIKYLIQKITDLNPALGERITVAERLNAADAFIATGSDNTARYFDYYFGKRPHIIRRNRTSVGVLTGVESDEQLLALSEDVLSYYGLGCRNVSTILIPDVEILQRFLRVTEALIPEYTSNHKYVNNYDYNKSIYLVNSVPHLDNCLLLMTEDNRLVSPISVLYYQTYDTQAQLNAFLQENAGKIQVVASADGWYPGSVPFGKTQMPGLSDYADGIDTMAFLTSL